MEYIFTSQVVLKYIEWNISAKYFFGIYSIITYKEYLFISY